MKAYLLALHDTTRQDTTPALNPFSSKVGEPAGGDVVARVVPRVGAAHLRVRVRARVVALHK